MDKEKALEELKPVKDLGPDEEIRQKEEIFSSGDNYFSVTLESILAGHEDKVYGLQWQKTDAKWVFFILSSVVVKEWSK